MKPIIIGIDPGTTLGYAILACDGGLLGVGSSKEFGLSSLINKVIEYGKPIIVGTDKARVPGFVESFGVKVGALMISPKEDLLVREKKTLADKFDYANDHERDAIAAAMFAYKQNLTLLNKISSFVEKYGKQKHKDKLIELVVLNEGLNISEAMELIEKPDHDESKIVSKVVEKRVLDGRDFFRLYSKVKQLEKENKLLKQQNFNLKQRLENIRPEKIKIIDKEAKELLQFKENRIQHFDRKLKEKTEEIERLKEEIDLLSEFLSGIGEYVLLKRLNTLSYNELLVKDRILRIKDNDVLLVDDVTIGSDKAIDKLKDKVNLILYRKASKKVKEVMPFLLVDASNLDIKESSNFGVVLRQELNKVKNTASLLSEIVGQYRKRLSK